MNINIPFPDRLKLLHSQEKFLIKLFVQFIENQTSLRRHQRTVRITVLLIPDVHDRLALPVNLIQHVHKILLIIPVIPVTLCHDRIHFLQSAFHHIVHLGNLNLLHSQLKDLLFHKPADELNVFLRKLNQGTIGRFIDSHNDFLYIKFFFRSVLLDHSDILQIHKSSPFYYILCLLYYFKTILCALFCFSILPFLPD